jgi:hypothetical protein
MIEGALNTPLSENPPGVRLHISKARYLSLTSLSLTGSYQAAACEAAPREFRPLRGSHAAALIAMSVTGREYHYPHCLSSLMVLPGSRSDLQEDLMQRFQKSLIS